MTNSFYYFAYASNLLAQRIHINGPSALKKDIGKLEDYRLDFCGPFSKKWDGYKATIVQENGKHVWGTIWEIDNSDLSKLDEEEGVPQNIYIPIEVYVTTPNGNKLKCRCYQLSPEVLEVEKASYEEKQPSQVYLQVIINGAIESQLPTTYIEELKNIRHNGSKGNAETPISF
ncbi:gamma-glutamylcyclotransferase-like [Periplaneta americana]|uniref:gamma-glutamylcyclotransferase-like n=1 Tax=Periplaneta americana TaxID=6978 RepID=UPI0037E8C415